MNRSSTQPKVYTKLLKLKFLMKGSKFFIVTIYTPCCSVQHRVLFLMLHAAGLSVLPWRLHPGHLSSCMPPPTEPRTQFVSGMKWVKSLRPRRTTHQSGTRTGGLHNARKIQNLTNPNQTATPSNPNNPWIKATMSYDTK